MLDVIDCNRSFSLEPHLTATQPCAGSYELTNSIALSHPCQYPHLTRAHHRVSSSSVVEHPTRSRRVVGSNPIWDSDFFRVYVSPRIYVISCCCYFSISILT